MLTLINWDSAVLIILNFTALLNMPLKEWNYFNNGKKKNSVHLWAQCKATGCNAKISGTKDGIIAHLKRFNYLEEEFCK